MGRKRESQLQSGRATGTCAHSTHWSNECRPRQGSRAHIAGHARWQSSWFVSLLGNIWIPAFHWLLYRNTNSV